LIKLAVSNPLNFKPILLKSSGALRVLYFIISGLVVYGNQSIRAQTIPIDHKLFDEVLAKFVDTLGRVDYAGLKKNPSNLNRYLELLSANPPASNWPREDQLAYWINVYNAFTLSLVVKHYPVESIKNIRPGIPFINSVWDIRFIKIGNETFDLNNIEHRILRKQFEEPRIHFAINCASFSCPRLLNEAYTGKKLESQLTKAARFFLSDTTKNIITVNYLSLSKIFDWFGGDFKKKGSLIDFLNLYAPLKISDKANINYLEYRWTLNKQ